MSSLLPLYRVVSISHGWFDALPEYIRDDVLAHGRKRALTNGQRLFSRGENADGLYCVRKGAIRISGISGDGREAVLDFYGPGTWFGEVSLLDGLPRIHDAHAASASLVLQVTPQDMEKLLATHPALSRALLSLAGLRLRLLLTALEAYSAQSLEQRLANRLLMLAVSFGVAAPQGIAIDLHLPQEILAQLIGATRQRVNQILKTWQGDGIVCHQHGRILLRDQARLEKLAEM